MANLVKTLTLALAIATAAGGAHAEPTTKQFLEAQGPLRQQMTIWLTGVENGFMWASIDSEAKGRPRIFCSPSKLALTAPQLEDILRRYARENPTLVSDEAPAGFSLLKALQDTFPCGPA